MNIIYNLLKALAVLLLTAIACIVLLLIVAYSLEAESGEIVAVDDKACALMLPSGMNTVILVQGIIVDRVLSGLVIYGYDINGGAVISTLNPRIPTTRERSEQLSGYAKAIGSVCGVSFTDTMTIARKHSA